jgi:tripeptidyl-peptidase I
MGTTVLYGSGDDGVAGYGGVCLGPEGQSVVYGCVHENISWQHFSIGDAHCEERKGGQCARRFSPMFPATCPFVTAVGATQINPNSTVYEPESACEQQAVQAYSGGGFSNIFSAPHYQQAAVRRYLKHHPPPYTADQYNNSGMVKNIRPPI